MKINHLQLKLLLLPKQMIKIKKMNKIKMMVKIMIWAMIKGVEKDEDEYEQEESKSSPPPHPRVRQIIQCDHSINNILGDIKKGVTTQSHIANFYEHYSFVLF
jgi:hypothetical protein